jgi:hypothetical protein
MITVGVTVVVIVAIIASSSAKFRLAATPPRLQVFRRLLVLGFGRRLL